MNGDRVRAALAELGSVVIAYSGGVDSSLVAALAREVLGERAIAVTGVSPTYTIEELESARAYAHALGIGWESVLTDESADKEFVANPPDRCFYCKRALVAKLDDVRRREGFAAIVDGTNADDALDDRPGRRAATDAGVVSPLLDAGMTKRDVRDLARALEIPGWDKPSAPCLASRIPFGTPITLERLSMVERAERAIRSLGFADVRVRHHGDVARIEVPAEDIGRAVEARERLTEACLAAGFTYVSLDLLGYRTGSMNEVLGHAAADDELPGPRGIAP
jgi:uncharacterized protein